MADSDRLVDDLLSKLEPPTLVALMDAVLEPGRLTNLSSMTQLCVLAAAASAAPDEFAPRLSNVEQLLARLRNSVGGSSLGREIASAHLTRLIGALKSDGTS